MAYYYHRNYNPHYWKCDPNRYPKWYTADYKSTTKDIVFALKHLSAYDAAEAINGFISLHPELDKHVIKDPKSVSTDAIKKTWDSFFPKYVLPKVCW